jgi:transposase, IS5 family
MRRELGQLSLADGLVESAGRNRQLERIAALVDGGPLALLRCLLLQQWYRLSDPGLEEALSDRLSFRRFVGLALADPVPDHSTLSRFRSELVRRGLAEPLLAELNRQLEGRGLMVKRGTLIDASLVEADGRRPRQGEPVERRSDPEASWNAMPELQGTPRGGRGLGPGAPRDPDHGERLGQDPVPRPGAGRRAGGVRRQGLRCLVVQGGDLARRGIGDGIMAASYWRRPLDAAGHARNRALGPLRAPVERSFAILKRWYGYRRVRYRSLVRNMLQLQLLAVAMNLRRALALTG